MNVIIKPRGGGKTYDLIKAADNCNGYIVCLSEKEARRIFEVSKKMNCAINFPITYDDFLEGNYYSPGIKSLHIDNVDLFLRSLSRIPIATITLTT